MINGLLTSQDIKMFINDIVQGSTGIDELINTKQLAGCLNITHRAVSQLVYLGLPIAKKTKRFNYFSLPQVISWLKTNNKKYHLNLVFKLNK